MREKQQKKKTLINQNRLWARTSNSKNSYSKYRFFI